MSKFLCDVCGYEGSGCPYPQENHCEYYKPMLKFCYGMRLRGFSIGCQPMDGFIERVEDRSKVYYDILFYSRKLSDLELDAYDLDYLGVRGELFLK